MKFDTGTYVVIASMIIFYLRMMQLRGRKRRLDREASVARLSSKNKTRKTAPAVEEKDKNAPPYKVTSWVLVAIAVVLSLLGLVARSATGFPDIMQTYWWVITSFGTLLFVFCFKV
ncbi:MAG: hypothetical protein C0391_04770 [Anaerolinea sp.]|nr:hypothetical protein [Anaerolinea sp.]